ncbi:MAG: HD domain-containing protein [Planctomycetes bacterium]|nr:HD domain-containing protein [Planctomycetota bacterium]
MYGRLIVKKGKKEGQSIFLTEGKSIAIGRGEESDIALFDAGLSRKHFQVEVRGGVFILTDLESTNGTFVNGQRITVWQLSPGDLVTAGTSAFELAVYEEQSKSSTRIMCWDEQGRPAEYQSFRRIELEKSSIMQLPEDRGARAALNQAHSALTTLYKVGNLIHSETDLDKVFQTTMDAILETIKADRGFLVMWDKHRATLEPVVVRHGREAATDTRLTMSQTVLEAAVIHGHSLISADALTDDRLKSGESILLQHIRSVMCVPVQSKEQILGAIYLDTTERMAAFTQQDLELLTAIARQAGVAIERAKLYHDMELLFKDCIKTIVAAIEAKDKYTHGHSERVTMYAMAIARDMGFTPREMENLQLAGLLHDVGKIGIPERILTKPGRLTPEEYEIMKAHPVLGAEMIKNIHNTELSVAGIRWHHERVDGKGYPDGLSANQIPLIARVLCVADSYDAMTSNRPYKKNLTDEEALEEVRRCKGTQFDPEVTEVFLTLLSAGKLHRIHLPQPSYVSGYQLDTDEGGGGAGGSPAGRAAALVSSLGPVPGGTGKTTILHADPPATGAASPRRAAPPAGAWVSAGAGAEGGAVAGGGTGERAPRPSAAGPAGPAGPAGSAGSAGGGGGGGGEAADDPPEAATSGVSDTTISVSPVGGGGLRTAGEDSGAPPKAGALAIATGNTSVRGTAADESTEALPSTGSTGSQGTIATTAAPSNAAPPTTQPPPSSGAAGS